MMFCVVKSRQQCDSCPESILDNLSKSSNYTKLTGQGDASKGQDGNRRIKGVGTQNGRREALY